MIDKELLYDKCEQLLNLLETLRDIEIDDDYYRNYLKRIDNDLDFAVDYVEHMIAHECVGPKK